MRKTCLPLPLFGGLSIPGGAKSVRTAFNSPYMLNASLIHVVSKLQTIKPFMLTENNPPI